MLRTSDTVEQRLNRQNSVKTNIIYRIFLGCGWVDTHWISQIKSANQGSLFTFAAYPLCPAKCCMNLFPAGNRVPTERGWSCWICNESSILLLSTKGESNQISLLFNSTASLYLIQTPYLGHFPMNMITLPARN